MPVKRLASFFVSYTEGEVSGSWYTEDGGISLFVHCRGRYQALGTLKRKVSGSWYTEDEGVRLLVH